MVQTRGLLCTSDSGVARCHSTPVSLLANELYVRSDLHGEVSLAAVNHICVIHEAMNSWKKLNFIKGLLRKCKCCGINYN